MSKVVLDAVQHPNNGSIATQLNDNFDTIEEAFDNTLSRDGSSPNAMEANLDMNSNRIINLPEPVSGTEPVRLADIGDAAGHAEDAEQAATEAAASAATAATSATNAAASESAASTSASNAATSATNASNSATAAAASATAAQTAADSVMWQDVVFITNADSPYSITSSHRGKMIAVDASGGAVSISLPSVAALDLGTPYVVGVKKTDGSGNAVTISADGTDTIDGSASKSLASASSGTTLIPDVDPAPDRWTSMDTGAAAGDLTVDTFSGTGAQTAFTLSIDPGVENNTFVFISGVYQQKSEYSVSGTTLTFTVAPPTGTNNIQVVIGTLLSIGTPADGTVTTAKIADGAVTTTKIADSNVTAGKLAADAVTTVKILDANVTEAKLADNAVTENKIADGAVTVDKIPDGSITEAKLAFTPGGGGGTAAKNAIINGDMNIWQRGTSFTSINNQYAADRFAFYRVGASLVDATQSTDVPSIGTAGRLFNYSLKLDCQTTELSIAASEYAALETVIEGYNWLPLAQREITLSFYVKSTKTGTFCVALRNSGADRSCVKEYTVNVTNTWEKKTVTFPASPSAGTWNYTNGIGAVLTFTLFVGSTYQTTPDAWQTGQFFGTSNQVNGLDSTSNDFLITGIQLEPGDTASDFEYRSITETYAMCQRYYSITGRGYVGKATSSTVTNIGVKWPVPMRTTPTLSLLSSAATAGIDEVTIATRNVTAVAAGSVSAEGGRVSVTCGGGGMTLHNMVMGNTDFLIASAEF